MQTRQPDEIPPVRDSRQTAAMPDDDGCGPADTQAQADKAADMQETADHETEGSSFTAIDSQKARDILAKSKGHLRLIDGARIALAFYRHEMFRVSLGAKSYPHGQQCEAALADYLAPLMPSRGPVTVAELCALFSSLASYAPTVAEHQSQTAAAERVFRLALETQAGSGARHAARFILNTFGDCVFSISEAFAAWDSEHRAAFAQAAALIAARGI